jgi:hypothetical protein
MEQSRWRRRLSREVAGLIAIKLAALALLWWLFFSPAHRTAVAADTAARRLGVVRPQTLDAPAPAAAQGAARD